LAVDEDRRLVFWSVCPSILAKHQPGSPACRPALMDTRAVFFSRQGHACAVLKCGGQRTGIYLLPSTMFNSQRNVTTEVSRVLKRRVRRMQQMNGGRPFRAAKGDLKRCIQLHVTARGFRASLRPAQLPQPLNAEYTLFGSELCYIARL
jgi:hypothetical protein